MIFLDDNSFGSVVLRFLLSKTLISYVEMLQSIRVGTLLEIVANILLGHISKTSFSFQSPIVVHPNIDIQKHRPTDENLR